MSEIFPDRHLDADGRCCGRKPLFYKTRMGFRDGWDPHHFCTRCDAEYDTDGKQRPNWAWTAVEGGYVPTYPTSEAVANARKEG